MKNDQYILFQFEKGGVLRAKLDPEKAPKTVDAILAALPIKTVAKQARTGGAEVYCETSHLIKGLGPENLTEANFGAVQFASEPYNNIVIYYDTMPASPPFNEFAAIVEEDIDELKKIGYRIWEFGFEKITIIKVE